MRYQLFLFAGDEMEEKQQLEEQMRAVMDKYKYKRRQIRELQEDLKVFYFIFVVKYCTFSLNMLSSQT